MLLKKTHQFELKRKTIPSDQVNTKVVQLNEVKERKKRGRTRKKICLHSNCSTIKKTPISITEKKNPI